MKTYQRIMGSSSFPHQCPVDQWATCKGRSGRPRTAVWETPEGTSTTVWIAGALIMTIIIVVVAVLYGKRANF
jgi:hypothetical protein